MDIKKTISSITVSSLKDLEGREFRTQLNIALYEVCSQAGFDVQKDADNTNVRATLPGLALPFYFSMSLGRTPAGTIVTDGVTDFYSCGNCIYIREGEDHE